MKYFFISFVALIMGLVLGLGFLYTEDNPDVDAQIKEYEWDVLPGVPIRYGALSSFIKITQEWHSANDCPPPPHAHNLCSLDFGQVDGQPVHAVFRRSSGVDLIATFTLTSSDPEKCRSVTAEIIETATGKTVATVYYVHVLMSISSGTKKNLSDLNIPISDAGNIGTVAVPHHDNYFLVNLTNSSDPDISQTYKNLQAIYKNKPSSQWDGKKCPNSGPHLHQMVVPGAIGLVQQNRDDNDLMKGISKSYTYISPHMWLWKIALTAPAITATRAPSEIHPSKLTVSTITVKRVGLPESNSGLGGMVKTNPVDGPYVADEDVTLTAEDKEGYLFAGWDANSGCPDLESPSCTITLPGADRLPVKTVTATFAPSTTLTTRTWIEGARTSGGGGAISPASDAHPQGRAVNLTARAAPTHLFSRWEVVGGAGACDRGSVSTGPGRVSATCTVTLTADTTVIAYFVGAYGLTVPSSDLGSIKCTVGGTTTNCEGATTNYASGTKVWLRATPDNTDTHEFSHWTVSTSGSGASGSADTRHTKNPLDVTLDADTTVTATFRAKPTPTPTPQCTLSVVVNPSAASSGSASATGDCGSLLTVSAPQAATGYEFTGWSTPCSGKGSCSVTVGTSTGSPRTTTVTANYARHQCTLTVSAGTGGTATIGATATSWTGDCGTKLSGTTGANAAPRATANSDYYFTGWTSSPSGWTGGCSGTGSCTPTVGSATGTAGTYRLTAGFARRVIQPPPPPTGGTYRTWPERVTRYGWTASCARGGGSGNDNGTKYANTATAEAVARVWIHRNCPRAGGTYDIIDTTTYYWSVTCRIGTGSGRDSGYASWSAAETAARAWGLANCPRGGGTSGTNETTRWYADVTCAHGSDFTVGPRNTEAEAHTAGELAARVLCPRASVSGDAPTPTAEASDDDVGGQEGHSAYTVRSVTTYGWTARCTNGGRSSSRSGYGSRPAAASAARAWITANCAGGGLSTIGPNTTYGWEASCTSGGGSGSGSGRVVRSTAVSEASAWIDANCAGGGTFDTLPSVTTTYGWTASCNSGSGSDSRSGYTSELAAESAAQAWINANCG